LAILSSIHIHMKHHTDITLPQAARFSIWFFFEAALAGLHSRKGNYIQFKGVSCTIEDDMLLRLRGLEEAYNRKW
jgi:hypothetical protein